MSALSDARKEAEIHFRRRVETGLVNIKLTETLKESRDWLHSSLGLVDGSGPPNWDGIRELILEIDAAIKLAEESGQ